MSQEPTGAAERNCKKRRDTRLNSSKAEIITNSSQLVRFITEERRNE
jgi:hypothetical protein